MIKISHRVVIQYNIDAAGADLAGKHVLEQYKAENYD
jgi:hypothetical protein